MKTFDVEPSGPAIIDSEEAFLWLYKEAPDAAFNWYEGLLDAFRSLESNPFRCSLAQENIYFEDEVRQLLYGNYRIIFTVRESTVVILHVRHGARQALDPMDADQ